MRRISCDSRRSVSLRQSLRKVRADALAQVDALADVERQRVVAVEEIDAGRFGQRVERVRRELRRQARDAQDALDGAIDVARAATFAIEHLHERPERARVAERAMPIGDGEPMARDHRIESVPVALGKQPPRQAAPCTARAR